MSVMNRIREDLQQFPQILVVCTGNTCRSPMAQIVLREKLNALGATEGAPELSIISSGASDEEHGSDVYPPAHNVLRSNGYQVPDHFAHRTTQEELTSSGLILAMTARHAHALAQLAEQWNVPTTRIHLWREFDGTGLSIAPAGCFLPGGALAPGSTTPTSATDVPDPWYGELDGFYATFDTVVTGADGLINALQTH